MKPLAQYTAPKRGLHSGMKTTITEDREYTVIETEETRGYITTVTILKFRNCPTNEEATLQFDCSKRSSGKRGAHFSFNIPGPLVQEFLQRMQITYTPPKF